MATPTPAAGIVPRARVTPNLPANYEAEMAAEAAAMRARIGAPSGDFIRLNKDKTFSLPNGEKSELVTGVIVDFVTSNQFYHGAYDRNNIQPPVCQAVGLEIKEMRPFGSSPEPQNVDCHTCWANAWGSAGEGKKGKKCKNHRLLALVPPNMQLGGPLMLIKVSATGIKHWDNYVGGLNKSDATALPLKVVTNITFDPNEEYQTLRFALGGPNDAWQEAYSRRTEARKRLLTEPDMAPKVVAAPPPAAKAKPAK